MKKSSSILYILILLLGCIEPYEFENIDTISALVVDSSLTDVQKAHYVKLSSSLSLDEVSDIPVVGATVWIESDSQGIITLDEVEPGVYLTDSSFAGIVGTNYTLFITTPDGNEYKSTTEVMLPPAPIDSVYGQFKVFPSTQDGTTTRGVQFLVNAQGLPNRDSFYRYEVAQDYEIKLPYVTPVKWIDQINDFTERDTLLYLCYQKAPPLDILITTTGGQSSNIVSEFPIVVVEEDDPYLLTKYSLNVTQFSISSNAFQYYKALRENNEAAGTFFDKQKGAIYSNIKSTNSPSLPVLGYFEVAGTSTYRNIYTPMLYADEGFSPIQVYGESCAFASVVDTVTVAQLRSGIVNMENRDIFGFSMDGSSAYLAPKTCTDCRNYGSLEKPGFWN